MQHRRIHLESWNSSEQTLSVLCGLWMETLLNYNWICLSQLGFVLRKNEPDIEQIEKRFLIVFHWLNNWRHSVHVYLIDWIIRKQLTQYWEPQSCLIQLQTFQLEYTSMHTACMHECSFALFYTARHLPWIYETHEKPPPICYLVVPVIDYQFSIIHPASLPPLPCEKCFGKHFVFH